MQPLLHRVQPLLQELNCPAGGRILIVPQVAASWHLHWLLPELVNIITDYSTTALFCYKPTKHKTLERQVAGLKDQCLRPG